MIAISENLADISDLNSLLDMYISNEFEPVLDLKKCIIPFLLLLFAV